MSNWESAAFCRWEKTRLPSCVKTSKSRFILSEKFHFTEIWDTNGFGNTLKCLMFSWSNTEKICVLWTIILLWWKPCVSRFAEPCSDSIKGSPIVQSIKNVRDGVSTISEFPAELITDCSAVCCACTCEPMPTNTTNKNSKKYGKRAFKWMSILYVELQSYEK